MVAARGRSSRLLIGLAKNRANVARLHRALVRLICVTWLAASGTVHAQALYSENFDSLPPGGGLTGLIPGSGLTVTSGDADIIGNILNGAASAYSVCPAGPSAANNCLDLNGNGPGSVSTPAMFNLTAGTTYVLNFSAAGSVANVGGAPYTFTVTLGNSAPETFSLPANSGLVGEQFIYTPEVNQPNAALALASTTSLPGNARYGPVIDNLNLSALPPSGTTFYPFMQSFNKVQPGSNFSSILAGTRFAVVAGNVDVLGNLLNGAASGFYTCPPGMLEPGNCIDLNGDQPGEIESRNRFYLSAGTTYAVTFELAGNVVDGINSSYPLTVSLGGSGPVGFSAAPGSPFTEETLYYTPIVTQPQAPLIFAAGPDGGNPLYGPIISEVSVSAVPEPREVFMLPVLLVLLAMSRRRRAC